MLAKSAVVGDGGSLIDGPRAGEEADQSTSGTHLNPFKIANFNAAYGELAARKGSAIPELAEIAAHVASKHTAAEAVLLSVAEWVRAIESEAGGGKRHRPKRKTPVPAKR